MSYVNRVDRIIKVMSGDTFDSTDWLYMSSNYGESEHLWSYFKDKVKIRRGIDGNPKLSEWCQLVYDQLPNDTKIKRNDCSQKFLSCKTAHKMKEPLAVMVCTMEKWLTRNMGVVFDKMEKDDPSRVSQQVNSELIHQLFRRKTS